MKHIQLTVLAAFLASAGFVSAQTKAPEPEFTLTYNAGVVSDYRYRGISQSGKKPALQAGVDYANKNGVYLGAWGSTISWIKDSSFPGTSLSGPVEIDLYGGYKGEIAKDVAYDVGGLYYWYTGNNYSKVGVNANTFELYGAVTAGPVTAKYSQSTTNLFGAPTSKNSSYLDISATFDMGNGLSLVPHIGSQKIKNAFTYTDYSFMVNKDIDGLVIGGGIASTNKKNFFLLPGSGNKDLGSSSLVLSLKKNF
jgi:uncharacterized protein (TIGR02001 family)